MTHEPHLSEAIRLACESVHAGGGPFGALVVLGNEVVGRGTNRVVAGRDPTAHAEIVALRAAALHLGTHELSGATLYASCEPCPMCAGAILWSRLERVVYAATRAEAAAAGFDDERFLAELQKDPRERRPSFVHARGAQSDAPFRAWHAQPDRVPY